MKLNISKYKIFPEGGRSGYYFFMDVIARAYNILIEKRAWPYPLGGAIYSKNHIVKWYFYESDEENFKKCIDPFIDGEYSIEDLKKSLLSLKNKVIRELSNDFNSASNKELIALIIKFSEGIAGLFGHAACIRGIDRGAYLYLKEAFTKLGKPVEESITNSSISGRETSNGREERELLELALKIKNWKIKGKEIESEINSIWKKYKHISCGYYNEEAKKILQLAGVQDIWCKSFGQTQTTINFTMAIIDAFKVLNKMKMQRE